MPMIHRPRHHHRLERRRGKQTSAAINILRIIIGIWVLSIYYFLDDGYTKEDTTVLQEKAKSRTLAMGGSPQVEARMVGLKDATGTGADNDVSTWKLPSEELFLETLTSCVPADVTPYITPKKESKGKKKEQGCLQHIPPGTSAQRIGILSPPGVIADEFYDWILQILTKYYKEVSFSDGSVNANLEVVSTSHVPPYGYGKNHGWTKIIRFVTDPIGVGVVDSMVVSESEENGERCEQTFVSANGGITDSSSSPMPDFNTRKMAPLFGNVENDISSDEIEKVTSSTLRQIVRWHCRLSHVSAHTALLTVTLQDLIQDPAQTVVDLLSFIFATGKEQDQEEKKGGVVGAEFTNTMDTKKIEDTMHTIMSHGYALFDSKKMSLDEIIRNELENTNNLQDWPCKSFWDVSVSNTEKMKKRAKDLAPKCEAAHTKCSVPRDRCEMMGDFKCLGVKKV